jgi:hypothetical protein
MLATEAALKQRPDPARRVPVEFIGKARLLRDQVARAHTTYSEAVESLIAPLRPRAGFIPTFTRQTMSVFAGRWRDTIPQWGTFRFVTKAQRTKLAIAETRITPFRATMDGWDQDELGVALAVVTAMIELPATLKIDLQVVVTVSLHALARRVERGDHKSDLAVLRDLLPLVSSHPNRMAKGGDFEIPGFHGGRWIGSRIGLDGKPVLAVRTYIGDHN